MKVSGIDYNFGLDGLEIKFNKVQGGSSAYQLILVEEKSSDIVFQKTVPIEEESEEKEIKFKVEVPFIGK